MRLTTYTDYAFRVLMHVALSDDRLVRIADIAASYDISRNHLMKVVHRLGARGYLQTVQGRAGGVRLARDAQEITVGAVVRDFEEDFALVQCFGSSHPSCRIQGACVLQGALGRALEAFLQSLDRTTLADLIEPRQKLKRQLLLANPGHYTSEHSARRAP